MTANTFCGYIPGGADLQLVGPQGPDSYFADAPNSAEIAELIAKYRDTAVFDVRFGVDKNLLAKNTSDLNKFIARERDRMDNAIISLANNAVTGTANNTNGSGYPTDLDDLKDIGVIFDATDPGKPLGLSRPTKPFNKPFQNKYPDLDDRLGMTPFITTAETQLFIRQNNFVPATFTNSLTPGSTSILDALNAFYGIGNFAKSSIGSFCALVPDIFAALNSAVDAFNDIRGYVDKFNAFLADPAGFIHKLSEAAVMALVDKLKAQVLKVVDQLAQQAIDKIKNITGGWIDPQYMWNHGALSEKFIREKEKAMNFFSEENLKAIKDKISGAISYAVGVFERMDLEEIQFLILRFCELIGNLEALFFGRTQTMTDLQAQYSFARQALTGSGSLASARAVQAGAIRYNPETRFSIQTRATQVGASGPISSSPHASPGAYVPAEARGVPANIDPITPEEIAQIPSFDEIQRGHNLIYFTAGLGGMGAAGWTGSQTTEKVMLLRLAKVYGKLGINSAYRSPEYNAQQRGSATNSLHISGKAFDVRVTDPNFINIARSVGFSGFGKYASFTHIDTGAPRTW